MQTATIFNQETVVLDGEHFADCEFRNCRLIYRGGEVPHFDGCQFEQCDWKFEDAAARTLALLKRVWTAGGKSAVQLMIKEITREAR
ncbi:hypothetical protein ACO2Q3_11665 [Caulobacter sp. KR2-114]|uniref:hypothetical protein n=1 Tax=Caulobacter sp. KR2-114 TaxID=3400912 RepID=UPI003BFB5309